LCPEVIPRRQRSCTSSTDKTNAGFAFTPQRKLIWGFAYVGFTSLARVQFRLDYQGLDMNLKEKVSKGVTMLTAQGHRVEGRIQFDKHWWEIDGYLLASQEEIEHIADGVYSFPELHELCIKRRADEKRKAARG
jgi:hypothetical protein